MITQYLFMASKGDKRKYSSKNMVSRQINGAHIHFEMHTSFAQCMNKKKEGTSRNASEIKKWRKISSRFLIYLICISVECSMCNEWSDLHEKKKNNVWNRLKNRSESSVSSLKMRLYTFFHFFRASRQWRHNILFILFFFFAQVSERENSSLVFRFLFLSFRGLKRKKCLLECVCAFRLGVSSIKVKETKRFRHRLFSHGM